MQQNYNNLQTNKFLFSLQRIPETAFRVTSVNFPSVSIPAPSTSAISANQFFAGSSVEYNPITLTFIVDDDLKNYIEIFNWITTQQFNDSKLKPDERSLYSDGSIITLTNASNANVVFEFKDMFPVDLGGIMFSTQDTPSPVTCEVTFQYSYFKVKSKS
jgi:T4-like virus tail tube protein gp19